MRLKLGLKKILLSLILLISVFEVTSVSQTTAHNITPSNAFRWEFAAYNSSLSHKVVRLQANDDNLVSNWSAQLTQARGNWNTNSNNYVNAVSTSFSESNVDYASLTSWPIEYSTTAIATTRLFYNGSDITASTASMNTINYAQILTNPAYNTGLTNYMYRLILAHETGHVMGLGHPPEGTGSIMEQGQVLYEVPQNHDRSDLASYYN